MERKLGEVFEFDKEWYQTIGLGVQGRNGLEDCEKCAFYDICGPGCLDNIKHIIGECGSFARYDGEDIIYKKLEKVGKPYYDKNYSYVLQKYRCYIPAITPDLRIHILGNKIIGIENRKNMERGIEWLGGEIENTEVKKDNYNGYMDKECIPICDALNSIPDVHTTESCCGHCKDRFRVFFTCDNPYSLAIIARVFDKRYSNTHLQWIIELITNDDGTYEYFVHSIEKYTDEKTMMKDVFQLVENVNCWTAEKYKEYFIKGK